MEKLFMEDQQSGLPLNSRIYLRRVLGLVDEMRKLQSDLPFQTVALFVCAAANPGISMDELRQRTKTKQSTCSRTITVLSEWREHNVPGFGLIWTEEDPKERRRKLVHLTEKGEELAAILADIVR